jgi:5-methylcytosine-specific restriction enzyme A
VAECEFYHTRRWKTRRRLQILHHPLCVMCTALGKAEPATIADHVVPHRGDPNLFWLGELQSLCTLHHESTKKREEARGYSSAVGKDGFPLDPSHPFYTGQKVA